MHGATIKIFTELGEKHFRPQDLPYKARLTQLTTSLSLYFWITYNIFLLSVCAYKYVLHNDVSVNDGLHIRRWSHNIRILTIMLQVPTVFNTIACCTGL